ncbi:ROK family transcriptional regulator [Microbacterium aerolatum]|uniref:ROK family transcriptional regulator n=1 Tax=Microbacterium aerolatum TaxID=153731 RepID=UPI00384F1D69
MGWCQVPTIGTLLSGFGAGELFQILRDGVPRTRSELAALTGFSRATIATRIDELLKAGLISPVADAVSTGGRPPARVALNAGARLIAAADFGATHVTAALIDLNGDLLVQRRVDWDIAAGPQTSLDRLADLFHELLLEAGRAADELIAIGIGLPGPVEHSTGRPTSPPIMPGWDGYDVPGHLRASFDVPVLVDNDVNVMALGEQSKGWPNTKDMMFVKVSTGIGSGIISGGTLQRGADGSAGDIGHIAISRDEDIVCRCGNTGCLEAVAGAPAIAAPLAAEGLDLRTTSELLAAVRSGDLRAMRAIRDAGRNIGHVLNMCVSIVNPSLIVIGGSLSESNELLIAGMREVVYSRSMPLATQHLTIAPAKVGPEAGVIGAGMLAIEYILSPAALDSTLNDAECSLQSLEPSLAHS